MELQTPWASPASALAIAIVGDYDCESRGHSTTYAGLHHAARTLNAALDLRWVSTTDCEGRAGVSLRHADGVFITTGSPYLSLRGALDAIAFARTSGIPTIGTCGGFQHMALEYARGVLGCADAGHAEYAADAEHSDRLFVTKLQCSLAGKTFDVQLEPNSRAGRSYDAPRAEERYYCSFGLRAERVPELERAGLRISGRDGEGEPRILELADHPFFIGTLFVPQARSTPQAPHPLLVSYLRAVAARARARASDAT
jgi:CTP synthase (UTP-ammonia lyase)